MGKFLLENSFIFSAIFTLRFDTAKAKSISGNRQIEKPCQKQSKQIFFFISLDGSSPPTKEKISNDEIGKKKLLKTETTTTSAEAQKAVFCVCPTYFSALRNHSSVWSAFNKVHTKAFCIRRGELLSIVLNLFFPFRRHQREFIRSQPKKKQEKREKIWNKINKFASTENLLAGIFPSSWQLEVRSVRKAKGRRKAYNNRKAIFLYQFACVCALVRFFSISSHQLMTQSLLHFIVWWRKISFRRFSLLLIFCSTGAQQKRSLASILSSFVIAERRKRAKEKFQSNWLPVLGEKSCQTGRSFRWAFANFFICLPTSHSSTSQSNGSGEVLSDRHPRQPIISLISFPKKCKMKLTTTRSVEENVYDLLSKKSENVFYKETKPLAVEGGGVCVCVQLVLSRTDQRVNECDGE